MSETALPAVSFERAAVRLGGRTIWSDLTTTVGQGEFVAVLGEFGGADVVLDNMGAAYLDRNIEALAPDGKLCVIGMQGGVRADLNLGTLMAKRATVHAAGLRARPATGRSSCSIAARDDRGASA